MLIYLQFHLDYFCTVRRQCDEEFRSVKICKLLYLLKCLRSKLLYLYNLNSTRLILKNLDFNPLTTTRRYTVAHFRRFFTVLEYSPIGVKFSPTTAPRTLYTVKKKNFENFQNFFSFESFSKLK